MTWTDIVSWVGAKAAAQKILAADFNLLNDNAKKVYDNTVYLKGTFDVPIIGQSLKMLNAYKPIAADHPWLCMSLPDAILDTTHYSAAFIAEMRSRKVVYDELNTNVYSFSGTWASNVFTLGNNAANNAMIAELAEEWLFAGSPTTNWRILNDGTNEFNITGITVASRTITVSGSPTGTSISIYLYRVLGSTTSCRHFSWAGLGLYTTGQNKITGLRRRDKLQGHWHKLEQLRGGANLSRLAIVTDDSTTTWTEQNTAATRVSDPKTDGTNGPPRTGTKTEIESATAMLYLYTGAYIV